jgi:hypothetical protein
VKEDAMTTEMTSLKARNLAVECLADVFGEAEADGFEGGRTAATEWPDADPKLHSLTASGFLMEIGGHTIRIHATIVRKANAR